MAKTAKTNNIRVVLLLPTTAADGDVVAAAVAAT